MLSLEGHKGVALTVMFIITLITSFSPIYLRRIFLKHVHGKNAEISLSGCLCAGAGVLMATVFLHILPEAVETVEGELEGTVSYPVTQISMCAGFFFVYLVEELVHHFISRKNKKQRREEAYQIPVRNGHENKGFENDENGNSNSNIPHTHDHSATHDYLKKMSLIASLIVVVALSFHGFMEGMALGLESHPNDVWLMFGALCSHKIFISFSMSMELLEIGVPLKVLIISMLTFDVASPIGGLVGAIVTANSSGSESSAAVLAPAFLQAISGGTILYVTFCEVLERERSKSGGGLIKFACLVFGFSIMAALQTLDHDEESEDPITTSITTSITTDSTTESLAAFLVTA